MKPYKPNLKPFSRNLRSNLTDAEQLLWSKLRRKQILGVQFYRQKPLAGFIADFYCAAANLVIELDGSQHFEPEHQASDVKRDQVLESMGIKVLRFDDRQVLTELDAVMNVVFDTVEKQIPLTPLLQRGGISLASSSNIECSPLCKRGAGGGFLRKNNRLNCRRDGSGGYLEKSLILVQR